MESIFDKRLKLTPFTHPCSFLIDQPTQIEQLISKLKIILTSLNDDKQLMEKRIQAQREQISNQLRCKEKEINTLKCENSGLREELGMIKKELGQIRIMANHLRNRNRKLQLQKNAASSVIEYLQHKNISLSEAVYDLRKNNNIKRRTQKYSRDVPNSALSIPPLNLRKQTFCQHTECDQKDLLPLSACKAQSFQISICPNAEDQFEKINVQKKRKREEDKRMTGGLPRVRSMGQIAQTSKGQNKKTRKQIVREFDIKGKGIRSSDLKK